MPSHRLSESELEQYRKDGFLIRESVFAEAELSQLRRECETLVETLVRDRQGQRMKFGSYTFDADRQRNTIIKWEGDSDVVHGIEPFAHLSPALHDWAYDARFIEPMQDIIGCDAPALFTEKLNLKRPGHGGANPMHQDYPYWVRVAEAPEEVVTSMLFLDDASLRNGCLHVVPGSHLDGPWATRTDGDRFAANEIDQARYPQVKPVAVEVPAGTVIMFGPLLVHQSAANRSDAERRALLYSYQKPGRRTQLDAFISGWKAAETRKHQETAPDGV